MEGGRQGCGEGIKEREVQQTEEGEKWFKSEDRELSWRGEHRHGELGG